MIVRLESVPICVRGHLGFPDCPIIAVIVVAPLGLDLQADKHSSLCPLFVPLIYEAGRMN